MDVQGQCRTGYPQRQHAPESRPYASPRQHNEADLGGGGTGELRGCECVRIDIIGWLFLLMKFFSLEWKRRFIFSYSFCLSLSISLLFCLYLSLYIFLHVSLSLPLPPLSLSLSRLHETTYDTVSLLIAFPLQGLILAKEHC